MHTDDDIFEDLNVDSDSENKTDIASQGAADSNGTAAPSAASEDDIFEDLDMEDKIFETALISDDAESEKSSGKGSSRSGASGQRSDAAVGAGTGRSSAPKRKTPKELNTADSSIDRKKITKEKEKKKKSKIKKIILCTIVELITLGAIFAYSYFLRSWNLIARPEIKLDVIENNNISLEKKKEMEGYWNIAIFGVDSRNSSVVARGLNSDVIIICSINKDSGDIRLVSVFRDTYLNISEKNSYNKINQAYAIGGPEQALAALNKNLDLNIQHYVTFNWKAVAEGINILGGVDDIPISKAELYYINAYITETVKATNIGSVQLTSTGAQHLDGIQAVAYGRLRYMDNDFARTERQRNIIKAAFSKAKKADFAVLNNIMVVCFPQVATNINFNDAIAMAQNITHYNIADTAGFPWSRGDANIGSKGDCVIPTTLESNVVKLHEFLFGDENYVPSDAVLSYSEKIKADSKLYKEGKFIDSVATDGGVIQKPKVTNTDNSSNSSSGEKVTLGLDESGNYIYPTDEDGNIIVPTDEAGEVVYPTDEDGNIIRESSRPTELSSEDGVAPGDHYTTPGGDIDDIMSYGPGGIPNAGSNSNTNPTRETKENNTGNAPQKPVSVGANPNSAPGASLSITGPVVSEGGPGSLSGMTGNGNSGTGSGNTAPGDYSSSAGPSGVTSPGADSPNSAVPVPTTTAAAAPGGNNASAASPSSPSAPSERNNAPGGNSSTSASPGGTSPGAGIDDVVVSDGP